MNEARREVGVAAVVLATSAFFFGYLWQSTEDRLGAASPTTVPLVVTGAIALLSILLLLRNLGRLRAEARAAAARDPAPLQGVAPDERARRRAAAWRGLALVVWTVLYLAALPWSGYLLSTAAYIGGLSWLFGNRSFVATALLVIVTPLALSLFFERYMVILLPSGALFS